MPFSTEIVRSRDKKILVLQMVVKEKTRKDTVG
jgi:hypothetical protein